MNKPMYKERVEYRGPGWYAGVIEGDVIVIYLAASPEANMSEAYDAAHDQGLGSPDFLAKKPEPDEYRTVVNLEK